MNAAPLKSWQMAAVLMPFVVKCCLLILMDGACTLVACAHVCGRVCIRACAHVRLCPTSLYINLSLCNHFWRPLLADHTMQVFGTCFYRSAHLFTRPLLRRYAILRCEESRRLHQQSLVREMWGLWLWAKRWQKQEDIADLQTNTIFWKHKLSGWLAAPRTCILIFVFPKEAVCSQESACLLN